MKAIWNSVIIAESDDTLIVEGNHYFPLESVRPNVLHKSAMKTLCPWKGLASYYHVEVGEIRNPSAAWAYRHPYPWIRKIKNRVAFSGDVEIVPG